MSIETHGSYLDLDRIFNEPVDWRFKAFPPGSQIQLRQVRDQGWNSLVDFTMPVLMLKASALHHNVKTFSDYCRQHGVSVAPHAKTSMSPQLVDLQLAAGAWGVTAATVSQARVWRRFGAKRIILANEVVDHSALRWLVSELNSNRDLEAYCLVDSLVGVDLLGSAVKAHGGERRLGVLVELGVAGGRTGCRSLDEALVIARAAAQCDGLQLAGVEGFEGIVGEATTTETLRRVDVFLGSLRGLVERCDSDGLFAGANKVIVTAGGSAFPDRVIAILGGTWDLSLPVEIVLRSGCYVTHDAGHYERLAPFGERLPDWPRLRNTMEVWGAVLSTPEPGLAVLGLGKRDVSYDLGLPTPLLTTRDGSCPSPLPPNASSITRLDDQHAYMAVTGDVEIRVGDLVGCVISHPCTAFDKWRLIPIVDDEYRVRDAVLTFF